MATVNGITQVRNFESITSNKYAVEQTTKQTSQPHKLNDWGFQVDIPYPLSVSAGTYKPDNGGEYPHDSSHRRVFVRDARPKQKFFYGTSRAYANGKSTEPQTAEYAGDRTFY